MLPRVLINDSVVSHQLRLSSLKIDNVITNQIDIAKFTLDGKPTLGGVARYPIEKVDEVIITDVAGQYITFDGINQYLDYSLAGMISQSSKCIDIWFSINEDGYDSYNSIPVLSIPYFKIYVRYTSNYVQARTDDTVQARWTEYQLGNGDRSLHHVVANYWYSGGRQYQELYVDGQLRDSDDWAAEPVTEYGTRMAYNGSSYGNIDVVEVAVYSRIQSSDEVSKNYNSGKGRSYPVNMSDLEIWWTFDELSGSTIVDRSGNDIDGTLYNNPTRTIDRHFAGYAADVGRDVEGITPQCSVTAQDYAILLETVIVNEIYDEQTSAYILNDLFSTYLPEINASTYVETGITHARLTFKRVTLREALDTIATEASMDWYIDYEKNLRFFSQETNKAPFSLSSSPDMVNSMPFGNHKYQKKASYLANRVTVEGGYYYSDDADFYLAGNGEAVELAVPYKLHAPDGETGILVYKNAGSDVSPSWSAQTVGIDNIDDLGDVDVLYNFQEKLLRFNTAPSDLKLSVKITGQYEVPVLVRARSLESYAKYGRWFDAIITDTNIDNVDWGKRKAKAHLAEYAFEQESGQLYVIEDGLLAGQSVPIYDATQEVDGTYLINQVTMQLLGGTRWGYNVKYGVYNPDLVDILIQLKRKSTAVAEIADDTVLNELLEADEDLDLEEDTDFHSDNFAASGIVGRWIAEPPGQGAGHHIQHEEQDLSEETDINSYTKNYYAWQ